MLLNCGVGEDSCESLSCKEIQPVHSTGDQSWVFIGRTDAKAETPVLWPPHAKSWLIGKDPDAGRDWGQEEKGTTEDEMAGWHHRLNGHEFEWTPGVGDGQGGLACCDSWSHKETRLSDWTELNWNWDPFWEWMFFRKIAQLCLTAGELLWIGLSHALSSFQSILLNEQEAWATRHQRESSNDSESQTTFFLNYSLYYGNLSALLMHGSNIVP